MVELQHLRLFVRASELNSFSKAAVALGIAQPTVSRIVRDLEREWDGRLFDRTGRGVTLSEFGEAALVRAKALLRQAEQTSEELRAFSRLPTGVVSLGLPPSLVGTIVPGLVNELRRDVPGVRLRIFEGFSDQIERWLSAGDVEVGLYSKYREDGIAAGETLFGSRLVLAAPRSAPPLPSEIPFKDLVGFPLVLPVIPNGLRVIVDGIARRLRVSLSVVVDADSILAQKQVSEHCGCYMIKAPQTIAEESAKGVFTTGLIVEPAIQRSVVLVTTRQRPLSRAAREVANRAIAILRTAS